MSEQYHRKLRDIVCRMVTGKRQEDLLRKLAHIQKLQHDKVLRVAVIGEFSSGKSTFINALLGKRILEEGVFPTTASATYIRTTSEAAGIEVIATFQDNKRFHIRDDSPPRGMWGKLTCGFNKLSQKLQLKANPLVDLQEYLAKYNADPIPTVHEAIRLLTSKQEVAQHVCCIDICLPRDNSKPACGLPENIILIDTPGFNPGQDSVQNHLEVTQRVVEHEADLAIILTPSGQAMSHTLLSFMSNSINAYLHRCVFVVTKSDLLDSVEERKEVMNYARQQLAENFNLSHAALFAVAARCMLPVKRIPDELKETWELQQNRFLKFEQKLWRHVETARKKALSEHALRLLADAVRIINEELSASGHKVAAARHFIEDNKVSHIQECTQVLVAHGKQRLQEAFDRINYSSWTPCQNCYNECVRIIRNGGKLRNFADKEGKEIQSCMMRVINEYRSTITGKIATESSVCMANELQTFDREFALHYKDMPTLRPKTSYHTLLPQPPPFKLDSKKMNKELEKLQDETPVDVPIFGRIRVPAELADLLGFFFKVDEREIQDKFIKKLEPQIRNAFSAAEEVIRQQARENLKALTGYMDSMADLHIRQYAKKVERVIAEQERQLAQIERDHATIMENKRETETIKASIQKELESLKIS